MIFSLNSPSSKSWAKFFDLPSLHLNKLMFSQGTSGVVKKCKRIEDQIVFAVKIIKIVDEEIAIKVRVIIK